MKPTHAVYTAPNNPSQQIAMTKVAGDLTRRQATSLAFTLRAGRPDSRTMVLVYNGDRLRSAF